MNPIASKTIISLILSTLLSGCATTPDRQQPTVRAAHPCKVVDSGKPLPEVGAEMIYYQEPSYPRMAEQAGLEGAVEVKALVGNDGSVLDAVVAESSGSTMLDDAALMAAPKCRFKPALRNGRPICMWVNYIVTFKLP
jgi:TonB family protein